MKRDGKKISKKFILDNALGILYRTHRQVVGSLREWRAADRPAKILPIILDWCRKLAITLVPHLSIDGDRYRMRYAGWA